jgi:uncharacterized protein DUF4920
MHTRIALALLLGLSLPLTAACSSPRRGEPYGAPLSARPVVPLAELLATPERFDGHELVFEGRVSEVCARKGCWMTLASGAREVRVTFQDYGFFVPLDSAGATVRAEGRFEIRAVPADEAKHYLEDAGRHAEAAAITGPVPSYTFVASGVELLR